MSWIGIFEKKKEATKILAGLTEFFIYKQDCHKIIIISISSVRICHLKLCLPGIVVEILANAQESHL